MEQLMQYLPFLIPAFIIQLVLMITALVHILRHKTYKQGNRVLWIIVVVIVNIIGPILYFVLGRSDE
jgi:hypothetical protein